MNIKPVLYVFMIIALMISVTATESFNVIESSITTTAMPRASNSTAFNIQNTGTEDLSGINMALLSLTSGAYSIPTNAISFTPSTTSISASGLQPVLVTIAVPSGQKSNIYSGVINVSHSSMNDYVVLQVAVLANPDFEGSATPLSITQGHSDLLTVKIKNTGNSDLVNVQYTFSSFTSGSDTLAFTGSSSGTISSIPYESETTTSITFNPSTATPAGTYTGQVTISTGGKDKIVPLSVTIEPVVKSLTATTTNAEIIIDRSTNTINSYTTGTLNITNTGNYPITATYSSSDLTGTGGTIPSANVVFSSSSKYVAVGNEESIGVQVSGISASLPDGTYTGTITIDGADSQKTIAFSVVIASAKMEITPSELFYPESKREKNVSMVAVLKNTGDITLTGCTLNVVGSKTWYTGSIPSTWAAGSEYSLTLKSYIDENQDAGQTEIAKLNIACTGYTKTIQVKSNIESKLKIKSMKISINDESFDGLSNGELYHDEDLRPGDTFEIKLKVENLFDNDEEDLDIEDINVEAWFYDVGEDGDDIEGEIDEFDLKPEKQKEITIEWDEDKIDWDVDEGEVRLYVKVYGDDEDGAKHEDVWEIKFKIDRDDRDFRLTRAEASPSSLKPGNSFMFYVNGKSVGNKDDDVKLKITSDIFNIKEISNFEMGAYDDEDDCNALNIDPDDDKCSEFDFRKSFKIPTNIGPGTYEIKVELYSDNGRDKVDEEKVTVVVTGKPVTTTTQTTTTQTTTTKTTIPTTKTTRSTTKPKETVSVTGSATTSNLEIMYSGTTGGTSHPSVYATNPTMIKDTSAGSRFRDSSMGYIALLSILSIVILTGIIVLIIYAVTKRQ